MINSMNKITQVYILNIFLINKKIIFCKIFVYGLTKLENKARNSCTQLASIASVNITIKH